MTDIKDYKTSFYSLEECKQFVYNKASNIDYAENEAMLTAIFHYLEEYQNKLNNESK